MKKRFSTKAFILATLIHLAVMSVLFDTSFRLLAEWRRTGVEVNPVWLKAMWWIWEPLPMLIQRMYPLPNSFYAQIIVIWSLCVGAIFGFLVPRFPAWRTPDHLTGFAILSDTGSLVWIAAVLIVGGDSVSRFFCRWRQRAMKPRQTSNRWAIYL